MNQQQAPPNFVKYVPRRKIRAVGSYYSVYEAVQVGLNRPVELRVLNCKVKADSPEFMRFTHEFKTLASLDHPNIIRVHDLGIVSEHVFYVTDLRVARSLSDLLDHNRRFAVDEVFRLGKCLASALDHLHGKSIIHRNLTTGTIFIDQETDNPYIAEFSLVKNFNLQSLTLRGIPQMTELMRTPEFLLGLPYDQRTDLFQLGSLLFKLLTGEEPKMPNLKNPDEDPELTPRFHNPDVPEDLSRVIAKSLRPRPDDRYPNAKEFLEDLRKAEDKINMKEVLTQIHETSTTMNLSRELSRHQESIGRKRAQDKESARSGFMESEQTVKISSASIPKRSGSHAKQAPGGKVDLKDLVLKNKSLLVMVLVPVIVVAVVGVMVVNRTSEGDEGGGPAQTASRPVKATPQGKKYSDEVKAEAEIVKTAPTTRSNFHHRWYLLDNWVKQLQTEQKSPPFSKGDLVSIRINFYRDEKEASQKLDELYNLAAENLSGGGGGAAGGGEKSG